MGNTPEVIFVNVKSLKRMYALVLVLVCAWAVPVAAHSSGLTLPSLLVPQDGVQAAFVIVEKTVQEVADLSGFFLIVDAFDGSYEQRAVRAHYTVLSSKPDEARLLVRAQPIDPVTRELLGPVRWEGIFVVMPDGVYEEWQADVPQAYAELVRPAWLTDWSAANFDELPKGEIQPGTTWTAAIDVDLFDLFLDEASPSLSGHFLGWEEIPGAAGPVAHIVESFTASGTVQQEVFQNVYADQVMDLVVGVDHWLIPGHFPYGAERSVYVTTRAAIGPETGAPPGLEGSFEVVFQMAQSIETDPDANLVWLEWDGDETVISGQTVSGVLGPWSEQFGDGTYMQVYTYHGQAGENVAIRLESGDFDAYLLLYTDESELLAQDDDSSGGTDSLITYQLPYDGLYYIVVNTVFEGEEGGYMLSIE